MKRSNVSLTDINVYAAQTLDRYHLNQLDISFVDQSLVNLRTEEKHLEQWTVDEQTALQIGWDLNIIPRLTRLAMQHAEQVSLTRRPLSLSRSFSRFRLIGASVTFVSTSAIGISSRRNSVSSTIRSTSLTITMDPTKSLLVWSTE